MKREQNPIAPFQEISHELEYVSGGRRVSSTGNGTDPALLAGVQNLVKAFGSINDNKKAADKQNEQQMMQTMMQKFMG